MSYEHFSRKVIEHLNGYNRWEKGTWRDNEYEHIVEISGKSRLEIVREIMLKDGLKEEELDLFTKPHSDANHLNSSQVLCYEFFRPMMTVVDPKSNCGQATEKLVKFIKETMGVIITENAVCQFEYEDITTKNDFKRIVQGKGRGENSSFDFHIQDKGANVEIYFEIKYTEQSFGGWRKSKDKSDISIANHCAYIEKGYKRMLKENPYFKQVCKDSIASIKEADFSDSKQMFNKHYQLFRNTLKAGESSYSVLIYPDANPGPKKEFESFKDNLIDGQDHIIALKWENLKSYMLDPFFEKFIRILNDSH